MRQLSRKSLVRQAPTSSRSVGVAEVACPSARLKPPADIRDGKLDDQIRLESVLLRYKETPLPIILIAGQRIDGSDTQDELQRLVDRVVGPLKSKSYRVVR